MKLIKISGNGIHGGQQRLLKTIANHSWTVHLQHANILNANVDDYHKGNYMHTFKRAAFTNKHKCGCSPFAKNKKKKKKNRIPYSKPEQVAIYLEIQGNSSSPTPLIFLRNASQNAARGHKKRKHL